MLNISFGEMLKKSFEDGKIHANYLKYLLENLLMKFDLENVQVEIRPEKFDLLQSENDNISEIGFCAADLDGENDETKSSTNIKTIHFNSEEDIHSKNVSLASNSGSSFINYFKNNYNSQSFQTLGLKSGSHLQEIPAMKALPPYIFPSKSIDTDTIHHLESHLRSHCDAINMIISQNQFFQQQQICNIQNQQIEINEKIKDLFFACELNEEKFNETLSNVNSFNEKIFCLKSDVKILLKDSCEFKEKLTEIENDCKLKEYSSEVDEKFENFNKSIFSEMQEYTKLERFIEECKQFNSKFIIQNEIFDKFEKKVRKAFLKLKLEIDEKLEKDELKKFKIMINILFNEFMRDMKKLISKNIEESSASGIAQSLTCLSCQSKVSELNDKFIFMDKSESRFKFFINKMPVPKRNISRINFFAQNSKSKISKRESIQNSEFTFHTKESLISFPNTRQCFIISKDNTIFKADPLKCLKNPNYTRI